MTEPTPEEDLILTVPLKGREITVSRPTPEQLLVWQRTVRRLTDAPADATWSGTEAMAALERARRIVDSLIVHPADVDWLDDRFLDKTVTFQDLAPFINDAITAFNDADAQAGNRETRRAAKKATGARKKAKI